KTLPFLTKNLPPATEQDWKRLQQLIDDLDNDQFKVREKAMAGLKQGRPDAERALRQALTENRSLEARRRIEELLPAFPLAYPPETVQQVRAIQVLEQIGSAEAVGILESLVAGAASAYQTREAKEALDRLAKRRPAK